ncbi:HET domain containing protein [Hyaloscypha variabilis]
MTMESSVNNVSYEPLPSDGSQIRLVAIMRSETNEVVECTVAHYPFNEETNRGLEYEALSYVWGDTTVTVPIKLNGQTFQATRNLEAALRSLRHHHNGRLIWIDAICINQRSIEERNQEVPRMDQIYRNAVRVVVWLGCETEPGEPPPVGLDPRRDNHIDNDTFALLDLLANADEDDPNDAAMILHRTGNEIYAITLLARFFSRPWFRRIWIFQEVGLAKVATIMYGHSSMDWDRFTQAVEALNRTLRSRNRHVWRLTNAVAADKVRRCRMQTLQTQQDNPPAHFQLEDLLWQTRHCRMTDPRDRLYGLLGLVKGRMSGESLLEIDYAKPVADVFLGLSVFMIQRGLLSETLCSVTSPIDGLPSWVTNWMPEWDGSSVDGSGASWLSEGILNYMRLYQLWEIEPPENPPRFSTDLRQVTLRGRVFDAFGVWHIGKRFERPATNDMAPIDQLKLVRERLIEWEDEMEKQQSAQEQFEKQQEPQKKFKTPAERRENWQNAVLHELRGANTELGMYYKMLTDRGLDHELDQVLAEDYPTTLATMVDFQTRLGDNFQLRTPFITLLGIMGSTGNNCVVQFQDVICVFVGCAVPFLLRPAVDSDGNFDRFNGGPYTLVGCCWVPTAMNTDILEGERRGLFELYDITLV